MEAIGAHFTAASVDAGGPNARTGAAEVAAKLLHVGAFRFRWGWEDDEPMHPLSMNSKVEGLKVRAIRVSSVG